MQSTYLIVFIILAAAVAQFSCVHHPQIKSVPTGFDYPATSRTINHEEPFVVRRMEGKVLDRNGNPIHKAFVEILTTKWTRVEAQLTDPKGTFMFNQLKEGSYNVRVACRAFRSIEGPLLITKSGSGGITFVLDLD